MASAEWAGPWACRACTFQHIEPPEVHLASCSICGARRPVRPLPDSDSDSSRSSAERFIDYIADAAAAAEAQRRRQRGSGPPRSLPPWKGTRSWALRAPASAATLRQLVTLLGAHEPDLEDHLLGHCKPRYSAAHQRELPRDPAGPLGMFVVVDPQATTEIGRWAFKDCLSLVEITLPPTVHPHRDRRAGLL